MSTDWETKSCELLKSEGFRVADFGVEAERVDLEGGLEKGKGPRCPVVAKLVPWLCYCATLGNNAAENTNE